MKNNTRRIFKYLVELLIVVFGVFFGLYASEIQSEKRIKREKQKSINYIVEELRGNKEKLEATIRYHKLIRNALDSIAVNLNQQDFFKIYIGNEIFKHNEIKGWKGVQIANLESTAFEAAKISGIIKEYDIGFIRDVSKIYSYQEEYLEFGNSILERMININSSSKVIDAFSSIELMTHDLVNYEEAIFEEIEKIEMPDN